MFTISAASRIGVALALGLLMGSTTARAGNPCIGDAKETFTDCKGDCKESYQAAKDACLNRDHDCVEGCRAGRAECIDQTSLDEDLAVCRNTLRDAKQACRDATPGDEGAIDQCIDARQVEAFLCRRTARKTAKPAITACRTGFRACAKACPTVGDVIDKVQCKIDAKNGYLQCKADCREGFQEQKDICLDRDHACVEGCRAGRDGCREDPENDLDAAIAICNATKTAAVDQCKIDHPEGSQERADCITDALVVAFQCRDQAREDAKPRFEACRAGFQACAEACPPAS